MSGNQFSGGRKFRAKWTTSADGTKHPSKGEATWWDRMRLFERARQIFNLKPKPRWEIFIAKDCPHCKAHGEYVGYVEADAEYDDAAGAHHFVDYKGGEGETPISKFKRRVVLARFGTEIELVGPYLKQAAQKKARAAVKKKALAQRV